MVATRQKRKRKKIYNKMNIREKETLEKWERKIPRKICRGREAMGPEKRKPMRN